MDTASEPRWADTTHPLYRVSDQGDIRNTATGRILVPTFNGLGYRVVQLGHRNHQYTHHLVAAAFLGPKPEGHQVAFRSRDRTDCRAANLRYATPSELARERWERRRAAKAG